MVSTTDFDRDEMARWYANEHLKIDPGVRSIYYLTKDAPNHEIRFLEVNDLMAERDESCLEPFDFGVDVGSASEHKLFVLDVTPAQWERITRGDPALRLPQGWSLDQAQSFNRAGSH